MKFLVDFDRPHYLTLVLPFPPALMHYLLVINLPLPLIWGVIEVVVEVEVEVEVVTKGIVVVNKGVKAEDMAFVSALIVMVRIIQYNFVGSCMENPRLTKIVFKLKNRLHIHFHQHPM